MSKSVCIIIPYFGKLPKNIITFLVSCKYNKKIHWLIFTNDSLANKLNKFCQNVTFIKSNLMQMKKRAIKATGLKNINLDKPYKLCDYRPVYGKMFADYLKGYDYWGYSDVDIVYGNLWKYINKGLDQGYKKIGHFGHFTLFHNDAGINNLYKLPIIKNNKKIYLFKNLVSKVSRSCSFDEGPGINIICKQRGIKTYLNPQLVNEIIFPDMDLNTLDKELYKAKWQCYVWHNGKALFYYSDKGNIKHKEYGYFHFQKRPLFNHFIYTSNVQLFSITTYGYNEMNKLNTPLIKRAMHMNKSSFIKRFCYKLKFYTLTDCFATRMHIGKIKLPVKYILNKVFIDKDFRIFKI